jgi:hypothetical protein
MQKQSVSVMDVKVHGSKQAQFTNIAKHFDLFITIKEPRQERKFFVVTVAETFRNMSEYR